MRRNIHCKHYIVDFSTKILMLRNYSTVFDSNTKKETRLSYRRENRASFCISRNVVRHCSVCHIPNAEMSCTYDNQTCATTNVVDVKWAVTVINKLRLPPALLMRIPAPAHRRWRGSTWWIDTKFSEITRLIQRFSTGKNAIFTYPACILSLRTVVSTNFDYHQHWSFVIKLESMGWQARCLRDPTFSRFVTTPTCDGPTYGRTDTRWPQISR